MARYAVYFKETQELVYSYEADTPVEWMFMEFATHEHRLIAEEQAPVVEEHSSPYEWLVDIGAFFDRFGAAKMAILTSTHPVVKAIIQDVQVRKWVDLRRPDVADGVKAISSLVPALTSSLVHSTLTTPVRPDENLALRITYFKDN
jgi:hypothetical protein